MDRCSSGGRSHSLMLVTVECALNLLDRTSTETTRTSLGLSGMPMRPLGAHRTCHTSG